MPRTHLWQWISHYPWSFHLSNVKIPWSTRVAQRNGFAVFIMALLNVLQFLSFGSSILTFPNDLPSWFDLCHKWICGFPVSWARTEEIWMRFLSCCQWCYLFHWLSIYALDYYRRHLFLDRWTGWVRTSRPFLRFLSKKKENGPWRWNGQKVQNFRTSWI